LHLEKGDILLIKHPDMIKQLEACSGLVDFKVPIVLCPQGVQILKRQDLLNLLEQLEEDKSVLPAYNISEGSSAPI